MANNSLGSRWLATRNFLGSFSTNNQLKCFEQKNCTLVPAGFIKPHLLSPHMVVEAMAQRMSSVTGFFCDRAQQELVRQ